MRLTISFLFIIFQWHIINAQAVNDKIGLPFSHYYSSTVYKGGIQNMEITQGQDGLIYVANNFGLLVFDGVNWSIYNSRIGSKCRFILIGNKGEIFTAGQGDFGYYKLDSQGDYQYISLADSLPDQYNDYDETWRIYQQNDLIVYCTFDYLFYFDKKYQLAKVESVPPNIDSYFYINNYITTNQDGKGILQLKEDEFRLIPGGSFFKNKKVSSIIALANEKLLVSTLKDGIYIINNGRVNPWNPKFQEKFKSASINTSIRLSSGKFALGTLNDGLLITDKYGNIQLELTKGHGLENRTVLSLYEDMNKNLWIGHNNGISLVELNNPFSLINEQYGLPGTGYDAFLDGDELTLGTNNGLFLKKLNNSTERIERIENSIGQVYTLNKINSHLLSGHHGGSFVIENMKSEQISDIDGSWTFLPLRNHPSYVLQGNYTGLSLFKIEGERIRFVRKIKGFSESSRVMEQDNQGNIWMTHGYKGVFKFNLNDALDSVSVQYYGPDKGLPSKYLINVWKVNNQLIFTSEAGIFQYDQESDTFIPYTLLDPYLGKESQIITLAEDPIGNIYYASPEEIGVLEKNGSLSYTKHTSIFNRIDLLLNDDLQNIIALEANQILFAAKEGFIHFNNNYKLREASKTKTLIRKIELTQNIDSVLSFGRYNADNKVDYEQPKEAIPSLPFEYNSLQFSFIAPFLEANDKTEYQYWLEGSEEDGFSVWNNNTVKEYTNLHEGIYTFWVRSKNVYGDITEPASYQFIINPPWYRTNWAYSIYVILSIFSLMVIYFIFEKRFQKQTSIITKEKEQEINRIDTELKSSEQLIDQLRNDQLKAQIDVQNKELATSTMQIINKNEFIDSVKGGLNNVIKRSKNQEVKSEIKKIINNIEKNIASDKDWENFSLHFDKVHGDFTHRFKQDYPDISPQEMKLSAYLRMNLSTKEIAHLLNISVRGVEIARYRLRKKLKLERSDNLQEFILSY